MRSKNAIFLGIYLTFWATLSYSDIGTMTSSSKIEWYFPLEIILFMGFPAFLGYLIGKEI